MNKQNIPAVPDENKMEELLGNIQPVPSGRFHQIMQQAVWRVDGRKRVVTKMVHLKTTFAIVFLIALTALFVTPQGRAWAQEVFQFFAKINSTTVEIPESQSKLLEEDVNKRYDLPLVPIFIPTVSPEMAALPGCEIPQRSQAYSCQITLAESQLGFDLKELPSKLEEWNFDFINVDTNSNSSIIGYSMEAPYFGTLYLWQGVGDFPNIYGKDPWSVVPADKVEVVRIGNYNGEYVRGSFGQSTDGKKLIWDDSDFHQRLAWSDGTRWYFIELWSAHPHLRNTRNTVKDRDQLIELAESLVNSSEEKTGGLDSDPLYSTVYSISDAEKISGFDLKAPTLLPLGINFESARDYSYNDEIRLFYGINHELVIYAWKDTSLDLNKIPDSLNTNYKTVKIKGQKAFFGWSEGSYLFLWWQEDGINYQMHYYQYYSGEIDQKKMIAIAESMQDIDDFRKKESRPYEYVSIYEQALGLDVKEFAETPAKWSFDSVWPDVRAGCILLFYRSVTEPGGLMVHQCLTDQYFNVSDIPSNKIQRVRIGSSKGVYAAGDFVTGDNGQLIWDPASRLKRLYWQEDGIWIQMSISGETAALYNREDLISLAESLR
jgi:hypothetical protein